MVDGEWATVGNRRHVCPREESREINREIGPRSGLWRNTCRLIRHQPPSKSSERTEGSCAEARRRMFLKRHMLRAPACQRGLALLRLGLLETSRFTSESGKRWSAEICCGWRSSTRVGAHGMPCPPSLEHLGRINPAFCRRDSQRCSPPAA
ncbi:hypothetical protein LZ30DRAFT_219143 [Colletotrichum cereale]|nr:hypothetical protein LZ30DRAFT_219143 [Colletotrichum cereale]